jgi:pyruvate formate lyase activating enzyme
MMPDNKKEKMGKVAEIQRFSVHDGPGIRTLVFLKGCPLTCTWCQNPESRSPKPQLMFIEERCIGCAECAAICPVRAIEIIEGLPPVTDRGRCTTCGACATICPTKARTVSGKDLGVEEILREIEKDRVFYEKTGGGLTISGGEPLEQPGFAAELLRAARVAGIPTAIETCAYARPEVFDRVIAHADIVLFDVKHIEAGPHLNYTGVSNGVILSNLSRLAARKDRRLIVRYPMIPGVNDDDATIAGICALCKRNDIGELHILPFHQAGESKWKSLDMRYAFQGTEGLDPKEALRAEAVFEAAKIRVTIGGYI